MYQKVIYSIITILVISFAKISAAQNRIGHFGTQMGQCQALYDLGLIQDKNSKLYAEKLIRAWNSSDKRSANDFNRMYVQTKQGMELRRQRLGEEEALRAAKNLYPQLLMQMNYQSGVDDPNNSGEEIVRSQQEKKAKAENDYFSQVFSIDELGKHHGWYIVLYRGILHRDRDYLLDYINQLWTNNPSINKHPIRVEQKTEGWSDGDKYQFALLLGPFTTIKDGQIYFQTHKQDFNNFQPERSFSIFTGGGPYGIFKIIWSNGVNY